MHTDSPPENLTSGDTVRAEGTVRAAREGETKMGGTVRATEVDADSIKMVEESRTKSRGVSRCIRSGLKRAQSKGCAFL